MKKIGEKGEFLQDTLAPEPVGGRKCSCGGRHLSKGWMLDIEYSVGTKYALHLVHWSTEADLSPRARLIWG